MSKHLPVNHQLMKVMIDRLQYLEILLEVFLDLLVATLHFEHMLIMKGKSWVSWIFDGAVSNVNVDLLFLIDICNQTLHWDLVAILSVNVTRGSHERRVRISWNLNWGHVARCYCKPVVLKWNIFFLTPKVVPPFWNFVTKRSKYGGSMNVYLLIFCQRE